MTFGDRLPIGHPTGALAVLDKLHHSATNLFAPSVVSQVFDNEAKVLVETQKASFHFYMSTSGQDNKQFDPKSQIPRVMNIFTDKLTMDKHKQHFC